MFIQRTDDPDLLTRDIAPGAQVRFLIHSGNAGSTGGIVSLVELEPGAAVPLHRHSAVEQAGTVLDGDAVLLTATGEIALPKGTTFFAPAGVWHGLRAVDGAVRVLEVTGGAADPGQVDREVAGDRTVTGPAPSTLAPADEEELPFHVPEQGFHHLSAAWLVTAEQGGSSKLVFGRNQFEARRGAHTLHRHPNAEEFVFALDGEGVHLAEREEAALPAGAIVFVSRGEWHGLVNREDRPFRGLFGYLGTSSLDDAGYDLPEGA